MKQFAVIGVGNFGYYLAAKLYEKGHEVLAVGTSSAAQWRPTPRTRRPWNRWA